MTKKKYCEPEILKNRNLKKTITNNLKYRKTMANYFDWILHNPGLNHISLKIFHKLDIESLLDCAQVSTDWLQFIKENAIFHQPKFSKEFLLYEPWVLDELEKVKLLVSIGVDVNAKDTNGLTPFRSAIYQGSPKSP